jgi:hypothetical protein
MGALDRKAIDGTLRVTTDGTVRDIIGIEFGLGAGSYTITGDSAAMLVHRKLGMSPGVYTLAGQPAEFVLDFPLGAGNYTITGKPAALFAHRKLGMSPGAYALDGYPLEFLRPAHRVGLAAGQYIIVGSNMDFLTPKGGTFSMEVFGHLLDAQRVWNRGDTTPHGMLPRNF